MKQLRDATKCYLQILYLHRNIESRVTWNFHIGECQRGSFRFDKFPRGKRIILSFKNHSAGGERVRKTELSLGERYPSSKTATAEQFESRGSRSLLMREPGRWRTK